MDSKTPLYPAVDALVAECKAAAKQKDYEAALAAITSALKQSHRNNAAPVHMITLLDYRHSIHVRMNQLDSALTDGKTMIRRDRADSRGYIRCSAIEKLRDNDDAAIKYLECGLKNARDSDPNLDTLTTELKKTRDEISAALVMSRPRDPFATLPLEIVEMIVSYLDYRDHVRWLRVSRYWRKFLTSIPPLTDVLAFPGAKKPITPKMFLAALRRLKAPKIVDVSMLDFSSSGILLDRLKNSHLFNHVQHLEVRDRALRLPTFPLEPFRNLKTLVIDDEAVGSCTPTWAIRDTLVACPFLEVAKFHCVITVGDIYLRSKSLRDLEIHYRDKPVAAPVSLEARLPEIRRLRLTNGTLAANPFDFDLSQRLETLILDNQKAESLLDMFVPASLKRLELTRCRLPGGALLRSIDHAPNRGPQMHNLKSFSTLRTVQRVEELQHFMRMSVSLIAPGTLSSLGLSLGEARWQDIAPLIDSGWLRELESLQLDGTELKDEDSQWFLANCPNLTELHLINAVNVTGVFLLDMIKAPTCVLREVFLTMCHNVSKDIVPWAQEHGVEIRYKEPPNPSEMNGRKVREYY